MLVARLLFIELLETRHLRLVSSCVDVRDTGLGSGTMLCLASEILLIPIKDIHVVVELLRFFVFGSFHKVPERLLTRAPFRLLFLVLFLSHDALLVTLVPLAAIACAGAWEL